MHQQSRPSRRAASWANPPDTNPARPNDPGDMTHVRSISPSAVRRDTGSECADFYPGTDEEHTQKHLNLIIMQFFRKATLTVLSSRTELPKARNSKGDIRQSQWFNLFIDETDVYVERLGYWIGVDFVNIPPQPLCIEIYLDTKDLADGETLAIQDAHKRLWDVSERLNSCSSLDSQVNPPTQVVLERWSVEVTEYQRMGPDAKRTIPQVYKNGILLFRSLYAYARMMPAWKYRRNIAKQSVSHRALPLKYRISNAKFKTPGVDTLNLALYQDAPDAESHRFDCVQSPIGKLDIRVRHRNWDEFSVQKSESVLSHRFVGMDDYRFSPSYPERIPVSLPTARNFRLDSHHRSDAYGSLSTFHQVGAPATSPISTLRNARDMGEAESPPQRIPPNHRTATGSKSSLRGTDTSSNPASLRRTSVSFQPTNPFKAGSLSSSPVPTHAPGGSLGRANSSHVRNKGSMNTLPQAVFRTPSAQSLLSDAPVPSSASSSPKPAPTLRYSSSFSNRRNRFSSGGTSSKADDDNTSSGKGSASSSAQRLEGASSGSVQTDEDNISDFLKLLEQKKDLKSLNRTDPASRDASGRRTTAALYKYQRMRDSNAALSDSLSSLHLQRSSSSSSRRLSNVPGMVAGASVSSSSSPGKPITPHTPHTPAIPSRLSANSIIDYSEQTRSRSPRARLVEETAVGETDSDSTSRERHGGGHGAGTNAIDIPTSPRPWSYACRSSSVNRQNRRAHEDDTYLFGQRSASLPTEDRPDLSLSGLLQAGMQEPTALADAGPPLKDKCSVDAGPTTHTHLTSRTRTRSAEAARITDPSFALRPRASQLGPSGDERRSAAPDLYGSDSGLASGRSSRPGSRFSFPSRPLSVAANHDDDEPLLFTMSELGSHAGRRSIEEMRDAVGKVKSSSPWRTG